MRSENKNRKILPEVIQELFCVWRLQQSLTWRTLPQLSDFFQTWTGTVQAVVGGGDMEGEQRLGTGWCCFWLAAAIDDKCPTDYSQTQPQYIFKLYIREKPFVHRKQKHNPPHLHTVAAVRSTPTPPSRATRKLQLHTDTEGFCSLGRWYWWKS